MDVVMGQIDQSLDDFRSLVRESESVASAVADHYDEWWLAPVIEQYEGTGNPIHDGDIEWTRLFCQQELKQDRLRAKKRKQLQRRHEAAEKLWVATIERQEAEVAAPTKPKDAVPPRVEECVVH
jgi:hypothetical protein